MCGEKSDQYGEFWPHFRRMRSPRQRYVVVRFRWHAVHVATALRELRRACRWTQAEFAARLGIPFHTFRMWDCGLRPVPVPILARARAKVTREIGAKGPMSRTTVRAKKWPAVPDDYDKQLQKLRRSMDLSQAALAMRIGAANKAVIYQWESKRRRPTSVFWLRVQDLIARDRHRPPPVRLNRAGSD
jgi:DNA-binding transcriptional regulator YiaG